MKVMNLNLMRRARSVGLPLNNFLVLYQQIFDMIILTGQDKYEGDFVVDFFKYYEELMDLRSKLTKYDIDIKYFSELRKLRSRLEQTFKRLDKTGSDLIRDTRVKMLLTRFSSLINYMTVDVIGVVRETYPNIGYKTKVRRFRAIPIVFYLRAKPDELSPEAEMEAVEELTDEVNEVVEENERVAEFVAAENGQVAERTRMYGKVVYVAMTPDDEEKLEDLTSDKKEALSSKKAEIDTIKSDIEDMQKRIEEYPEGTKERNFLEDKVFQGKALIRGYYTGDWSGGDDAGKWVAVRESASTRTITGSRTAAIKGLWLFKGFENQILKLKVDEGGKVKSRGDTHVAGRIYEEGDTINGWLRFGGKDKYVLDIGNVRRGKEQDVKELKDEVREIRDNFDRYVYDPTDPDMKPVEIGEWEKDVKEERQRERNLRNTVLIDEYLEEQSDLRLSDEVIDRYVDQNQVDWHALTDEKLPDNIALTKMIPVVDIEGTKYVADGQFKGYPLTVLVNKAGRLLQGSAYTADENGDMRRIEIKRETGEMDYCVRNEPYITLDDNEEFIIVMPTIGENTGINNPAVEAIDELSDISASIHRRNDITGKFSRTVAFSLAPEDVDDIKYMIGSYSMSPAASKKLREYYESKEQAAKAFNEEEYGDITPADIPGMKTEFVDAEGNVTPIELRSYQKKTINYLRDKKQGIIGLDTGLGKSGTMISTLLNFIEDGTLDERNGVALFVVPASLRGNIPTEIRKWCEDPESVLTRVEVVSYDAFREMSHKELERYGAIFFDEAQALKNATGSSPSAVAQHALKLNHPHKILATASVMEKSVEDLYNLNMIANNEYNVDPQEANRKKKEFLESVCVMSGNRAVGVKNNPAAVRRVQEWVKQNFMYVSKDSVREEIGMKGVTPPEEQTVQVDMDENTAEVYSEIASEVSDTLERMRTKYQDRATIGAGEMLSDMKKGNVMRAIQELRELSNDPEIYMRKKEKRRLAEELFGKRLVKGDRLTREEEAQIEGMLDTMIEPMPNPKIEKANMSVSSAVAKGKKTAIWTDQPSFAAKIAVEVANSLPGKHVALCLADRIDVINSNGELIKYHGSHVITCQPVEVQGQPSCKTVASFRKSGKYVLPNGESVPDNQWQKYIIDYVLKADTNLAAVVLTSSYSTGHNLQWISSVIHMDRDNWNNEVMRQRTDRSYRQGQPNDVDVEIVDTVAPSSDIISINEVQRWMMEMEGELFDRVVRESMTAELNRGMVQFTPAQRAILQSNEPLTKEQVMYLLSPGEETAAQLDGIGGIE